MVEFRFRSWRRSTSDPISDQLWRAGFRAVFALALAISLQAQRAPRSGMIERAVVRKVTAQYGINSKVVRSLDLTDTFETKARWHLVITKQPDEESADEDGIGSRAGAFTICFVENERPDCSEGIFLAKYLSEGIGISHRAFYQLFAAEALYAGPDKTQPVLHIKTGTIWGANGNCGVSTFLLTYDKAAGKFRVAYFNYTGRNNNEETRFIANGPLLGSVVTATPTTNAPFRYFVEVFQRTPEGDYSSVLRYRSGTGYGDGNRLAVIDAEMPAALQRLGFWKDGDPLPVPPRMPAGCTRLVVRKGVEWCEPR